MKNVLVVKKQRNDFQFSYVQIWTVLIFLSLWLLENMKNPGASKVLTPYQLYTEQTNGATSKDFIEVNIYTFNEINNFKT